MYVIVKVQKVAAMKYSVLQTSCSVTVIVSAMDVIVKVQKVVVMKYSVLCTERYNVM